MHGTIDTFAQRLKEARATAPTADALAEMMGVSRKTLARRLAKYELPYYPRVVHAFHQQATVDRVCEMYAAGDSMKLIESAMGLSRGQVAGILNRNKMFAANPRRKPTRVAKREYSKRKVRVVNEPKFKPAPFRPRVAAVVPMGISFSELNLNSQCKWPEGDGPFTFCGHPQDNGPYCTHHASIAYRPLEARIREARPR